MRGRREFFRFPSKERESVLLKHFEVASPGEGFGAVCGVELPVDIARVRLHRAHGDKEIPGNLRVGPARGEEAQHFELTLGQRFFETFGRFEPA